MNACARGNVKGDGWCIGGRLNGSLANDGLANDGLANGGLANGGIELGVGLVGELGRSPSPIREDGYEAWFRSHGAHVGGSHDAAPLRGCGPGRWPRRLA